VRVIAPGFQWRAGSRTSSAETGLARNVLTTRLNWLIDHGIDKGRDLRQVLTACANGVTGDVTFHVTTTRARHPGAIPPLRHAAAGWLGSCPAAT
jgi:hypothetical protein